MKILIEIDCDNDAFVGPDFKPEISRLLHIAREWCVRFHKEHSPLGENVKLVDSNGNTCGKVTVSE